MDALQLDFVNFVSCSEDKYIKLWNINNDKC